jgi:hypothetical protein
LSFRFCCNGRSAKWRCQADIRLSALHAPHQAACILQHEAILHRRRPFQTPLKKHPAARLLPGGWHDARIVEAMEKLSRQRGTEMIELTVIVPDADGNERTLRDTASGATRVAGSLNFKDKYAPVFPRVAIHQTNPGRMTNAAELE